MTKIERELILRVRKWERLEGRKITPREVQAFTWSLQREQREKCRKKRRKKKTIFLCPKSKIVRSKLAYAINAIKTQKTGFNKTIGCTLEEFKIYIENQFESGMSWDNHGHKTWHIDHIRPLITFDMDSKEDVKSCNHYTNLRPLWAKDNLKRLRGPVKARFQE